MARKTRKGRRTRGTTTATAVVAARFLAAAAAAAAAAVVEEDEEEDCVRPVSQLDVQVPSVAVRYAPVSGRVYVPAAGKGMGVQHIHPCKGTAWTTSVQRGAARERWLG